MKDNFREGIDFVITVYTKRHYLRMLVDSIHKYVKNVPYTINIVNCWYGDKSEGLKELDEMFGDDKTIKIIEGFDQSETTILQGDGSVFQSTRPEHMFTGGIDGNQKSPSTWFKINSDIKAFENSDREYICILDLDLIFLNEWVDDILPLLEDNLFISNRYDPGQIFHDAENPVPEAGLAKTMFFISKRSLYTEHTGWPNFDYRDGGGNISYYVQKNKLPHLILDNTYWNKNRRASYVRVTQPITYDHIKEWHVGGDVDGATINREHHLIDMVYGEQMYVNGKPFAFHQNRGVRNTTAKNDEWVTKATKYLEEN